MHNAGWRRVAQHDGRSVESSAQSSPRCRSSIASHTTECTIDEVVLDTSYGATLRQGVSRARGELRHIDTLLVRAVWECLVEQHRRDTPHHAALRSLARDDGDGGGAVHALTVEQRQAQVRAMPPCTEPTRPAVRKAATSLQPQPSSRFMWRETKVSRSRRTRAQAAVAAAAAAQQQGQQGQSAGHTRPASSLALRCAAMEKVLAASNVNLAPTASVCAARAARQSAASPSPPDVAEAEEDGSHGVTPLQSLSLLILRAARQRALLRLTLRAMQLAAHEAHERRREMTLRYNYYLQRRVLRRWCAYARREHARRYRVMDTAVTRWRAYVAHAQALRACVQRLRAGLHARRQATLCCLRRRLARCVERWRVRLAARREQRALCLRAEHFVRQSPRGRWQAAFDRYVRQGPSDTVLQGTSQHAGRTPLAPPLVTPVQTRFVLARLLHVWRDKAHSRQDGRVAAQHRTRTLQRRVLTRLHRSLMYTHTHSSLVCSDADEAEAAQAEAASQATSAKDEAQPAAIGVQAAARRPLVRVTVQQGCAAVMLPYKLRGALHVARCRLRRQLFVRWRRRWQARTAAQRYRERVCVHVMRRWLLQLARRWQCRHERELLWRRWRMRYAHALAAHDADAVREGRLLHSACLVWQRRWRGRRAQAAALQQECLRRWWERAALRVSRRVLRAQFALRVLQHWSARAQTRRRTRRNALVAETIGETVRLVWCFRQWHERMRQQRRLRLSLDVLHDLRREKLRRRCFALWSRRVFGPQQPSLLVDSHQASLL